MVNKTGITTDVNYPYVLIILRNYPNKIFLYPVIIRDTNFHILCTSCLNDLEVIALISAP